MSNAVQNFIVNLFDSLGLKRKLATLLQVLSAVSSTIPGGAAIASILQVVASYLGAVGVVHAAYEGTLGLNIPSSVGALLSALIAVAHFVPALQPYVGIIQTIATLLGVVVHANLRPNKK